MSKLIICNHKMNLSRSDAKVLTKQMLESDLTLDNIIVCPSFINLDEFHTNELGAQDCSGEDCGAFTGSVSPKHLKEIGVKYVILGHHERSFYETPQMVRKKVSGALRNRLIPIVCIGETIEQKELLKTATVIKNSIIKIISKHEFNTGEPFIIAYEPTWAIGTKLYPPIEEINDVLNYIKKITKELNIPNVLTVYGGSVSTINAKEILLLDSCDGILLGEASLNINELKQIVGYSNM